MKYSTAISERSGSKRTTYIARLTYKDEATGLRKEKSKSASSYAEARRALRKLEDQFLSGGQTTIESDAMTRAPTRRLFDTIAEHRRIGDQLRTQKT